MTSDVFGGMLNYTQLQLCLSLFIEDYSVCLSYSPSRHSTIMLWSELWDKQLVSFVVYCSTRS